MTPSPLAPRTQSAFRPAVRERAWWMLKAVGALLTPLLVAFGLLLITPIQAQAQSAAGTGLAIQYVYPERIIATFKKSAITQMRQFDHLRQ